MVASTRGLLEPETTQAAPGLDADGEIITRRSGFCVSVDESRTYRSTHVWKNGPDIFPFFSFFYNLLLSSRDGPNHATVGIQSTLDDRERERILFSKEDFVWGPEETRAPYFSFLFFFERVIRFWVGRNRKQRHQPKMNENKMHILTLFA